MATLDLKPIERGMADGAEAVQSNFSAIQTAVETVDFQTQQLGINGSIFTGNAYVTKQGRLVVVQYTVTDVNSATGSYFATLPTWAKPLYKVIDAGHATDGDYHNWSPALFTIDTDGSCKIQITQGYGYVNGTISFISAV